MKESVYRYQSTDIDLEILLDANRELNDNDSNNLRRCVDSIVSSIRGESLNLDPEVKERKDKEKIEIVAIFDGREIYVEEVDNEYTIDIYKKHYPWFIVTTSKGRIKLGWRKRVITISWDESTIEGRAEDLFPDEDVTKFDKTIHAWSYDKAREYINLLLSESKVVENV